MKSHRTLLRSVHGSGRKLPRRSLPSPFGVSRNRGRSASRVLVCESLENRLLLTAVRDLSGFATDALPEQDDVSSGPVDIGFEIDFGGVSYGQLFVNENGNVTFGTPFSEIPTTAGEFESDAHLGGPPNSDRFCLLGRCRCRCPRKRDVWLGPSRREAGVGRDVDQCGLWEWARRLGQ